MTNKKLALGPSKEAARIISFIKQIVSDSSAKGVVVGLSGGVDSAVTGALCVRALGKAKVLGVLMPSDHTPEADVSDAKLLAGGWGIRTETVPISEIAQVITGLMKTNGTKIARANVEARIRMIILYYHSNSLDYLVAGTDDRSEKLLGYFTKWGDGGVDFLPISHLYKTQVRRLGSYLGVPKSVVEKPASPQLWPGHKASDEIPADYEKLDIALHHLFDLKRTPSEAAEKSGLPLNVVQKALRMHKKSEHKRKPPPSL